MKRNKGKLKVDTKDKKVQDKEVVFDKEIEDSIQEVYWNPRSGSGSKKTSKFSDKSPTKKSKDLREQNDKPLTRKFTRDISDVAGTKLPTIPEKEILACMIPEGLSELQRIKMLLGK